MWSKFDVMVAAGKSIGSMRAVLLVEKQQVHVYALACQAFWRCEHLPRVKKDCNMAIQHDQGTKICSFVVVYHTASSDQGL